ncbi:MAG TPA: AAA family ATPase, partial [Acidimicrobiales bacterium]|nr:AAA family ATPase [Acidimicrobiales bacterium]
MGSSATAPRGADASAVGGLLRRDGLLHLLNRAVGKRVTVIAAPPGSGKTSLLRAWVGDPTNPRRVAFVSVARDQQDAQQFWLAVLEAVRDATRSPAPRNQPSAAALGADELLDRALSELSHDRDPVVLIIDDLHELRSVEALAQLERLLATLPGSARLVLSSRRDPPVRLHQLRLADEVGEIRASDLRFSERETRELLAACDIELSDAGAAALHRRTEGWAAGVRLAVMSLRSHPDPERFVAEFSGTNRAIGEYLMAEMLERQPAATQALLLRTSLVDRLNGELADLLAGRSGSERVLLELEDANAFVVSLDGQRTWFRYHQLLADFLRLELRRSFGEEVPDLHRRAARWLADQGDVVEAVRHTLAAGDWTDAARLLTDHLFSLTLDGREGAIAALLDSFPAGASTDHPELALARAAVQLAQGRLEDAAAQLALAESEVDGVPAARRPGIAVAIASLRLALARRGGHFTEVIEQVNLLQASIADQSSETVAMGGELRGVALMNLGVVEMWSGRLIDAERHLSEGAALAQVIRRPYLEVSCRAHRGFPSKQVSVATARQRGLEAVALAERYGWDDRPILLPALGSVGGMAIWMGEFDEGERWLHRAWEVGSAHVEPATATLLHLAAGMLHGGRGHQRAALDAFTAAAQTQSLLTGVHALAPRIAGWLATTQARLGMTAEAHATLAEFSPTPTRTGPISNARAWIWLLDGNPGQAVEALRQVRDATPPAEAFTLVEAHLLAGTAYLRLGDRDAAAAATAAAL